MGRWAEQHERTAHQPSCPAARPARSGLRRLAYGRRCGRSAGPRARPRRRTRFRDASRRRGTLGGGDPRRRAPGGYAGQGRATGRARARGRGGGRPCPRTGGARGSKHGGGSRSARRCPYRCRDRPRRCVRRWARYSDQCRHRLDRLCAHAGRPAAPRERLLVALGLETFDDLIRWTATATPAQVAALAPHVLNAAREGEIVAQRIVADGAVELAQLVRMLTRHFSGTELIKMATIGGLLRPGSPLLVALRTSLAAELPRARLSESGSAVDAPLGALRMAAQLI